MLRQRRKLRTDGCDIIFNITRCCAADVLHIRLNVPNLSGLSYLGEIIQAQHEHIMWVGCMAHGMNLMMKDFGKLKYVSSIMSQAKRIAKLIRNNDRLSNGLARLQTTQQPLVILLPGETRFCAMITMAERILTLQTVIEDLAEAEMWDFAKSKATNDRKPKFDAAKRSIERDAFWDQLARIVNSMEPMRTVLRLVDGEKPTMGIAYPALVELKDSITENEMKLGSNVLENRARRKDVLEIVEKRTDFILTPVYRAAYALNPQYLYTDFDSDVLDDLQSVLKTTLGELEGVKAYAIFSGLYKTRRGLSDSTETATKILPPHEWWKTHGYHLQPLAMVAMRLLAQVPSASACERNWSAYKFVHSQKRNKLTKKRSRDLVYVFQNMRAIKSGRISGGEMDFNEIDDGDYSVDEEEDAANATDDE